MLDDETYAAAKAYTDAHGGSGGGVTKEYVDEGLAEKVDKVAGKGLSTNDYDNAEKGKVAEAAISASATDTSFSLTDAADGNIIDLTIKGRTDSSTAASVGDNGLTITTQTGKNLVSHLEQGYWLSENGKSVTPPAPYATVYCKTNQIKCKPNTTYTISYTSSLAVIKIDGICYWDENGEYIEYALYSSDTNPFIFTTDANASWLAVNFNTPNNEYAISSITNIQLEEGSTATAYEPYKGSSATITTGLPYCSLSESLTDELDMVSGVVRKRCGKVVLDGSDDEGWELEASSTTGTDGSRYLYAPSVLTFDCKAHSNTDTIFCVSSSLTVATVMEVYLDTVKNSIHIGAQDENKQIGVRISNISTVADLKTYLAAHPVTVAYELNTPYDAPLTPAEITALTNLKTFTDTTNISCTDSPTMTVSYLLNTDNGQAAANMQVNILHALAAVSPEQHRMIFRGKNLGENPPTDKQLYRIEDGSFDDLFIGDYWVRNNVLYRIADMNYKLHCGDTPLEQNHLVIVPDTGLVTAAMNSGGGTAGGYYGSDLRETQLAPGVTAAGTALAIIKTAFPDIVLSHREYLTNHVATGGYPDGGSWYDSAVELMNENMAYGHREFTPSCDGTTVPVNYTTDKTQLALFQIAPKFISNGENWWLRDIVSATHFAVVGDNGLAGFDPAWDSRGVRPYFLIG